MYNDNFNTLRFCLNVELNRLLIMLVRYREISSVFKNSYLNFLYLFLSLFLSFKEEC